MTTATPTISDRIIPRNLQNEYAYAFGFLRGKVQYLIESANNPYYCSETRLLKIESMIADLESTIKQLESEMYPNA